MIKKFIKFILGLLLMPPAAFAIINFCKEIAEIPTTISAAESMFLYGVAAYLGIHIFIFKPDFLYVFGHESTHAMTAKLFRGKIFDFKVSSKGGGVKTDKSNTTVALTPYMIPFYGLLVCLVYVVVGLFKDVKPLTGYFIFGIGMSLTFHAVQTAEFLRQKQSDVIKSGYIFSIPLILLVNIAIIGAVLSFIFIEFSFKHTALSTIQQTRDFYSRIWQQLFM